MKTKLLIPLLCFGTVLLLGCKNQRDLSKKEKENVKDSTSTTTVQTAIGPLELSAPFATKPTAKSSNVIGWKDGQTPKAPKGFTVTRFAEGLKNPRWTYVAPNGDYFVSESKKGNILLFRDTDHDGKPDMKKVFLEGLNKPFGMLVLNDYYYVGNTDGLYRYPYEKGMIKMKAKGEKIMDLPAGGYNNHWTRNVIAGPDGNKIYITVGSSSNVGDHGMDEEKRRANIIQANPDGSDQKIYASGLRNPVGEDFNPVTGDLWTAVNERDNLGDDLVPDYATSVKEGAFYGWPFSYFGQNKDPRWKDDPHPDMVQKAIVPDVPLGSHTASLGFTFYTKDAFPQKYKNGAFIGQHGSWNRSVFAGYKVVFIPFKNGKPQKPEDFLTGFVDNRKGKDVHGRPVGVTQTPKGDLLVNDDAAGIIWRVSAR